MKPTDFFAGEDISRVSHAIAEAVREGYASVEATATTKDGAEIPFEFIGSRLKKSEGKIYIGGIGRDITEWKRAEEALRKSHDELEKRVTERTIELSTLNNQLESEIEMRKGIQDVLERSEESYRKLVSAITAYILLRLTEVWDVLQ
jgi:PAS domain-containing protein